MTDDRAGSALHDRRAPGGAWRWGPLGLALSLLAQPEGSPPPALMTPRGRSRPPGHDRAAGPPRTRSPASASPIRTRLRQVPPSTPASRSRPAPTTSAVAQEPSIIALDAAAHEHDRITFAPGGPVRVPFSPRPDDGWTVDGIAPRRLPAGAASGRAMAASRQGAVWAPSSRAPEARVPDPVTWAPTPIDGPAPGPAIAAEPVSALVTTDPGPQALGATDLRRQVFGFLPYWELNDRSTRLDYRLLSTIAYFGVGADADGDLLKRNGDGSTTVGWAGWTSSRMTSVIEAAHHRGTRVVLTVQAFGWTTNQAANQSALLGSAAARLKLARQIAAAVRDRGADGVNLDFEPLVAGRADEFVDLVRSVRAELNRIARGYQLTFDTTGSIGNYPIEAATAPGAADAIFIMGYDYRTASSGSAGSIAPLGGPTYDLVDTVLAFTDRVPARKLILGVPYYGRAWSTVSDKPRSKTHTGAKYGWSASVTYDTAVALAKQHGRRYDRRDASAWIAYKRRTCSASSGCVTTWREVYYDDAQSLRAKYDMINRYGLRGAGIWALGYDGSRPELYQSIVAKFLHDTTAPETGIDVLAARQGDEGFTVTWSAQDMNPIRNYDVQVSIDGGRWKSWLTGTKATEAILLGRDGHGYAFRARATDAKGNRGRWNIASLPSPPDRTQGWLRDGRCGDPDRAQSARHRGVDGRQARVGGHRGRHRRTGPGRRLHLVPGQWPAPDLGPDRAGPERQLGGRQEWLGGLPGGADAAQHDHRRRRDRRAVVRGRQSDSPPRGHRCWHGPPAFSPNGDGSEDGLAIHWTNGVALDSMTLKVLRADGSTVGTRGMPGVARGPQAWPWDGAVDGHRLVDGRYVLQLIGRAGSRTFTAPSVKPMTAAQVALYAVAIDTVGPRLSGATASGRLVSPARDGRHDRIAIAATSVGATRWRLTAAPLTGGTPGAAVRSIDGSGGAPRTSWDGRTDAGTPAADGRYRLTIAVLDAAGNFKARAWDVVVDGSAPTTVIEASPASFSPNGDGVADSTVVGWTASEVATTTVRIYHGAKLVRTFSIAGAQASGAIRWNGRSSGGAVVGDGTYQVRMTIQDTAGNRRTSSVAVGSTGQPGGCAGRRARSIPRTSMPWRGRREPRSG